jgi:hypothetical protein
MANSLAAVSERCTKFPEQQHLPQAPNSMGIPLATNPLQGKRFRTGSKKKQRFFGLKSSI